jgi:hypothetical protein
VISLVKVGDVYVNSREVMIVSRSTRGGSSIEFRNGTRINVTELLPSEVAEALLPTAPYSTGDL